MKYLLMILTIAFMTACSVNNGNGTQKEGSITYLQFRFHDSSVPPKYHRSYSIIFQEDEVRVTVDSYGDILADTTIKIGKDQVEQAFGLLKKNNIAEKKETEKEAGCTGGTGISVKFGSAEQVICDGYNYYCGGDESGSLKGNVKQLQSDLKELVPNFGQIIMR
ncbi:MAG: hypothetical protein H6600_03210 [Flavobacteriales bacterium]|nr:hypothetical protein [Flavobacteriales bacterium]MCB9197440.1 hypothetical protein [Flavobacteriales bacterium]